MNELINRLISKTLNGVDDSDQHLMTLFSMVLQLKAKKILELGVRFGHTSEPLLLGAMFTGGHLTSLDLNPTQWKPPVEFAAHYQFVQSDAIKFLEECVEKKRDYDLIYIDDWHTYAHVKRELELIDQISYPTTVILLHDLMGFNSQPSYFLATEPRHNGGEWEGGGPFKAVYELDINKWEWATIPVNNGLTLLRKRSEMIRL